MKVDFLQARSLIGEQGKIMEVNYCK